jgi:type IV secretory pathway TraG/TraD family ATPase VirD4
MQQRGLKRGQRAARRGVLGPGDNDPPPGSPDYYDYRGVATYREVAPLRGQPYTLGRCIDPARGPRDEIGLPEGVLSRHAAVVGPTGSGKTTSILAPWAATALRAGHSVVMVDVSGDLLDDLASVRRATGPFNARVAKWDFTDPGRSVSWNWLAGLHDVDALVSVTEALIGRDRPNDPQPFFQQRDRRVLRGLLEVLLTVEPHATSQRALRVLQDQHELSRMCHRAGSGPGTRLADVVGLPAYDFGRAVSGVVNALDVFEHPGVASVTSRDELDLDRLFDEPSLLVVVAPLHGSRTSESLASLILSQITRVLYRRFGHSTGTHVFLMIDEAPRLRERINLEEMLSVSRRARVTVCLAAQDVTQFGSEAERSAILSNCGTYVSLPTSSEASGRFFVSRLGQRQQSTVSTSRSVGGTSPTFGVNHSIAHTDVLGPREVMDPPWGPRSAVVHCPAVAGRPFVVDLSRSDLP